MDAAIYALAAQANKPVWERTAPRRIWFVVDRRIVVDEAFERARRIAEKLREAKDGPLKEIADRLREISGTERPLAVARLRGGMLRDDGWARLPSQPAVITSTVDQLGSRLLFRGYGHSARTASIFAGLAAHDSLILLDEAHLSVPFLQTLRAIERFRGERWAEEPIRTPFAFTMLSATPPADVSPEQVFPGRERASALDHPELRKRIRASKPAELVEAKSRKSDDGDPLVAQAVSRAREFALEQGRRRVAVVVNRVATAEAIDRALREADTEAMDVILLTGRLRPFERDRLVERWAELLRAGSSTVPDRPVVVVATQCIEVGADFSFDALISEAASLDALRQRFGRLNRLGEQDNAPAAILIRSEQAKSDYEDFIYGKAMARCWQLLDRLAEVEGEGRKQRRIVDFGIQALDAVLAKAEDIEACIAPTQDAPVLFPAHLDLLCQTAPVPQVQPDIELYLHGPERGGPEVRILWRADLDPKDENKKEIWPETVALCPPNSLEMLSVPLQRIRRWLKDGGATDNAVDVEGAIAQNYVNRGGEIRPVLVWRGRERSVVVRKPNALKPDDVIVLPEAYKMHGLGQSAPECALGESELDIWEPCHERSGKPPALRLHRRVLKRWLASSSMAKLLEVAEAPDWDEDDFQAAVDEVLNNGSDLGEDPSQPPQWLLDLLCNARHGRRETHPTRGLVLYTRRERRETEEQDLFADDDDMLSAIGREVTLATHSTLVQRAVGQLASRCLPEVFHEPLNAAAYWHDVGKLDERFQIWLRQGNEAAAIGAEPLAKSKMIPSSPARRRWLRKVSRLPDYFRHEMLSLQIAEYARGNPNSSPFGDLALHCVASHHGHGRPWAPVCLDKGPPRVYGQHDGVTFEIDSATRANWVAPHALESGITERFWRLNRRYGWWGLAYLEAILRLGDWYGSRLTTDEAASPGHSASIVTNRKAPRKQATTQSILLSGIDGSNPLGFLAALGVVETLHAAGETGIRLRWVRRFAWQPVIVGVGVSGPSEFAALVANALRDEDRPEIAVGIAADKSRRVIDSDAEHFRHIAYELLEIASMHDRVALDFLASFASDACIDKDRRGKAYENKNKKSKLEATPFQFIRGSGQQYFLGTIVQLMDCIDSQRIESTLFSAWRYEDEKLSLRWDPTEDRRYALMDRDPTASNNKAKTVWMANLLAYRALTLFPSVPTRYGLRTIGWSTSKKRDLRFVWPVWEQQADRDSVRALLSLSDVGSNAIEDDVRQRLRARGVASVFSARRIKVGAGANYKLNFTPSRGV